MNSTSLRATALRTGVIIGATALAAGLALPAAAGAAPGAEARTALSAQAVDLPEATELEKSKALAAIGIIADGEWIILPDRSFVSRVLTDAKSAPLTEVRAVAQAALNAEGADAATLFIRSEIFVAVEKDESRIRQEQLAKQQSREAKQRALAYLELPATPELLDLPDDQFIRRVGTLVTWDWGTRVQAGVNTALRGEAPEWKAFIETGVIAAHRADVEAYIQAQQDKTEAEKEALRQKDLKRRAASVVAWAPSEGELTLSSDNFIRKIEEKAVAGSEVAAAALTALRSPEPAVWAAFIETGVHAASERDKQIAVDKKTAADRKLTLEIQTRAEKTLVRPALAAAAKAALAGSAADVDLFLRVGQFDALTQSIKTTTQDGLFGYVQSAGGNAVTAPGARGAEDEGTAIANVTWKVVDGLSGESCFSFESAARPGYYLRHNAQRVELQPSDGSTEFKNAATWCSEAGKVADQGVSLRAANDTGRYLRRIQTQSGNEVWTANGTSERRQDRACGFANDATWVISAPNPKLAKPGPLPPQRVQRDPCVDRTTTDADFDGDGKADLLGYAGGRETLAFIRNTSSVGKPSRAAYVAVGGGWASVRDQMLGDFDGDGQADILGRVGDELWVWLNTSQAGKPTITDGFKLGTGWGIVAKLALADFDGDRDLDVVGYANGSNTLIVIPNTSKVGAPSRGTHIIVTDGWASVRDQMVGDFDGDGKTDILGRVGDELWTWRNTSTSTKLNVSTGIKLGAGWNGVSKLRLADYDADGRLDVVGWGSNGDTLVVIPNTSRPGAPSRGAHVAITSGWGTVNSQQLLDYDGDHKPDVVGRVGDELRVWLNTSKVGAFTINGSGFSMGIGWGGFNPFLKSGLGF